MKEKFEQRTNLDKIANPSRLPEGMHLEFEPGATHDRCNIKDSVHHVTLHFMRKSDGKVSEDISHREYWTENKTGPDISTLKHANEMAQGLMDLEPKRS